MLLVAAGELTVRSGKIVPAFVSALALVVSACGGSDGNGSGGTTGSTATPTPKPTPVAAGCSLRERQDWAGAQMAEWYLFPETLPANPNPAAHATLDDYIDALTATARSQNRDRYFTYRTSIAEENAYDSSGSSAGMGVRLVANYDARRLFVTEAFETGPAARAGIRRGTEIVAIGTSSGNLRTVQSIWAQGDVGAVSDELGPEQDGVTRVLQVSDDSGTRTVTVTKRDFALQALSGTYGYKILTEGGRQVGYLNLRTFISAAEPQLRTAFAAFRAAGVTELIVDLRYNGGGRLSVAELMGNLMGGGRLPTDVFTYTRYRPEKSARDFAAYFTQEPESISPKRIAFITSNSTASASEMVINAFVPYLGAEVAMIGSNTYGKPVGQIAVDRPSCDDRLRIVALEVQNSSRDGDYYNGLAGRMKKTCQAFDDIAYEMGDPREDSTRKALDFMAGKNCAMMGGAMARSARTLPEERREALVPARPSTAQREVPGLF